MKLSKLFLSLVSLLCLSSCGPQVLVTGEYTNPDAKPANGYNKIMVTAMVSNQPAKRAIENNLEMELEQENIVSTKGYELFPAMFSDQFNNDKDEMLEKIQGTESDAILTVSVLDKDTETRYVPGGTAYSPVGRFGWYGTYWGYHNYYYPVVHDPGYYATTQVYFIEANLYDVQSERLIWSAQTETYDRSRLESFAAELAKTIVEELNDEGLLAGPMVVQ